MELYTRSIGTRALPEGPYVLLVDDEDESVGPLGDLIRHAGFASVATRSVTDALACSFHRRPEVVVTDLVMPGNDGRALARRVRRRYQNVPILLVTGQDLEDPDWAIPTGLFNAIYPKPLDFEQFIRAIEPLMPPHRLGVTSRGRP